MIRSQGVDQSTMDDEPVSLEAYKSPEASTKSKSNSRLTSQETVQGVPTQNISVVILLSRHITAIKPAFSPYTDFSGARKD